MSSRRFLVEPGSLRVGAELQLAPDEAAHAAKVLRLKTEDEIELLDGAGVKARAEIISLDKKTVSCRVLENETPARPKPKLVLCPGLAKNPAMDLIAQKLTELMADEVRPFISSRSVPKLKDPETRVQRWRKLSLQALKQCGAAWSPEWSTPVDFSQVLHQPPAGALKLMLYEDAGDALSLSLALGKRDELSEVWVLVGPEGGFARSEVDAAREAGWTICTLPGAILRAETAALAAAAVIRFG
jgi:16S rRNA (uracil1498-N3)-methyltransferase